MTAIHQWMGTAQIRLDYDLKDRQRRNGHMDDEAYTWQLGLDRMLLSLAVDTPLDSEKRTLGFAELEPLPFAEEGMGDANQTLGHFCALLRKLHETVQELATVSERTAVEWRDLLLEILQRFFRADADSALDHYTLRSCINALATDATSGGYTGKLPFSIVQTILEGTLEGAQPKAPFLEGKITCCSMMPMREVPCKVLAMLGMDAGSFPHRDGSTGFTLLRRGSPLPYYVRSRIQEDQYIFLEALQSVREHLLIFYHGQDDKNPDASTAKLSPAPVVEELLAYAERACQLANGGDVREALVVKRSLNSFDAKSFRPKTTPQEKLSLRSSFSFDQVGHAIAMTAEGESSGENAWKAYYALPMPKSLPVPADNGVLKMELSDMERFFKSPAKQFLRNRLGFSDIEEEAVSLEDSERFGVAKGLDGWKVKKAIFSKVLLTKDLTGEEKVLQHLRRTSQLPLGELAKQAFQVQKQQFTLTPDDQLIALYSHQQSEEFSLNLEVPNNLMEGFPEFQELRQGECRLDEKQPADAPIPVCLHGYFPVAKEGTNCVVLGECFGKTPEARHKLVPYLRWLMAAVSQPEAQPLCQIVVPMKNDGKNIWTLKVPKKGFDAKAVLSQIVQLYLLGQVVPLPIMLNDSDNDAVELILGSAIIVDEPSELTAAKDACKKLIVPKSGTWS